MLAHRRMADGVIALFAARVAGGRTAAETAYRLVVATLEQYVSVKEASRWTDWDTVSRALEDVVVAYLAR